MPRRLWICGTLAACAPIAQNGGGAECEEVEREPLGNVPESQWPSGMAAALDDYEASVGLSIEGTVLCDLDGVDEGVGTLTIAAVSNRTEMELVTFGGGWCDTEQVVSCPSTTVTLDGWFEKVGFAPELELPVTTIEAHQYAAATGGSDEDLTLAVSVADAVLQVRVDIPPASDDTETRKLGDGVAVQDRAIPISCTLDP